MQNPKTLIIVATFHDMITTKLKEAAWAYLTEHEIKFDTMYVPGAFEIPATVAMAMKNDPDKYDSVVALGCVIRGETTHYDYVCSESARGLMDLSIKHALPMGYGILTCENEEQAIERADSKGKNKGRKAAEACVGMMKVKRDI